MLTVSIIASTSLAHTLKHKQMHSIGAMSKPLLIHVHTLCKLH